MSIEHTLDSLEAEALIGAGWDRVAEALNALRGQMEGATPQTILRVILLDSALRIADPQEDAIPFLAGAERWARGQDLTVGAARLCLMWCTEVGRIDPSAIPEDIRTKAVTTLRAHGQHEALWRQALAINSADNIRLLTEALDHLEGAPDAHTMVQIRMDLASAHLEGGATAAAVTQLQEALGLAQTHQAQRLGMRLNAMLGQLRMVQGMHPRALPHLQDALRAAQALTDTLTIVTLSSLISGLELCAEDWQGAAQTAQTLVDVARLRHNWMAVADGTITLSTCALMLGDVPQAVTSLVHMHAQMHGTAPKAALHLLEARLAELRHQLGSNTVDPLLRSTHAQTVSPA